MDVENNDETNLKKKKGNKRKIAARKIFNVVKQKVGRLSNRIEKQRRQEIRNKVKNPIEDENDVNKAKNMKELQPFKLIYYTEEDYEYEEELARDKNFGTKLEIAKGILLARIGEFKHDVKNLQLDDFVLDLQHADKHNYGIDDNDVNEALKDLRNDIVEQDLNNKIVDKNVLAIGQFLKKKEDEAIEEDNIITTTLNKDVELFRNNLEKDKKLFDDLINSNLELTLVNKKPIETKGTNFDNILEQLSQPSDSEAQFCEFMNIIKNSNDRDVNMIVFHIVPVVASLVKENKHLKESIKQLIELEKVRKENEIIAAKKGDKVNNFKNKEILKKERIENLKKENKFYEDKDWKKKPLIDKITERFNFIDFRQNPYINVWNKFSTDEKIRFIKLKLEWRNKRMNEFLKMDIDKNKDNIKKLNNFSYYEWRDPSGYLLPTYDIDDLSFYNKNNIENKDKIRTALNKASNNNLVSGFVIDEGNVVLSRGKAWFQMNKSLLGRKTKPSGNRNDRKN